MRVNIHASSLEKILLAKGIRIVKVGKDWNVSSTSGKMVTYRPDTGSCHRFDALEGCRKREELRGSPDRIAEILEGFVV